MLIEVVCLICCCTLRGQPNSFLSWIVNKYLSNEYNIISAEKYDFILCKVFLNRGSPSNWGQDVCIRNVCVYRYWYIIEGFPGGSEGKECSAEDLGLIPELGRSPGEGHGNPLQYSCLKNFHGQRSLVDHSPWVHRELDTTEWLSTHTHTLIHWICSDILSMQTDNGQTISGNRILTQNFPSNQSRTVKT